MKRWMSIDVSDEWHFKWLFFTNWVIIDSLNDLLLMNSIVKSSVAAWEDIVDQEFNLAVVDVVKSEIFVVLNELC